MIIFRFLVSVFAVALIGFGAIWTFSPIPFGFIFVIFGVLLLASVAPAQVRSLRKRWRWFDRAIHALEKRLPKWIARRLRDSDYDHDENEENSAPRRKNSRHS